MCVELLSGYEHGRHVLGFVYDSARGIAAPACNDSTRHMFSAWLLNRRLEQVEGIEVYITQAELL